jgi:hypothetical protein
VTGVAWSNRICYYEPPKGVSGPIGEIQSRIEAGFEKLFEAPLPSLDSANIEEKISHAKAKFRNARSSLEDRREAIRNLADVLEFLRPQIREYIFSPDESDLFNIVNNFGIRHHNSKQKVRYDKSIWCSWMFYFYLATIHAIMRFIQKN